MSKETSIRIFCGITVEGKANLQLHPISEIKRAKRLSDLTGFIDIYSNSPDFVSAISRLCEKKRIKCDFYLNGKLSNVEAILEDFNKAFEYLDNL